jgi:16S rRNA (uracil1498-N3)-methyltransferase
MTRKCFYIEGVNPSEATVLLTGQAAHHMENVLRLKAGDHVELRDGRGNGWLGIIEEQKAAGLVIRLAGRQLLPSESGVELTLAMGYARSDRMDWVFRQATELGVARLITFRSRRSQYTLSASQMKKRRERWLRIAREAMCQCGRSRTPGIHVLADLQELMATIQEWEENGVKALKVFAREGESRGNLMELWRNTSSLRSILMLIGPEGGWAPEEVDQLERARFHAVHLGPRILRLETAAIAIIASAQLLWGDLGTTGAQGGGTDL